MYLHSGPALQASSICRAAIHYGILDDRGGLVDVTRNGKVPFFVKSERKNFNSSSAFFKVLMKLPIRIIFLRLPLKGKALPSLYHFKALQVNEKRALHGYFLI